MSTSPTILYVMGFGRSGSTMLDIALDNHPEIQGLGELPNAPGVASWGDAFCSCGVPARECDFWEDIRRRFCADAGDHAVTELLSLDARYRQPRSFPRLVGAWHAPTKSLGRYATLLDAFYRSASAASGKAVLVDSSKHPSTAYALLKASDLKVRVLHLIRDGRAVLWSARRLRNFGFNERGLRIARPEATADPTAAWMMVNLISSFTLKKAGDHACRVSYENLVQHPRKTFETIGELIGVDLSDLAKRVRDGEPLKVGHVIAGNRIKSEPTIRLRADLEWKQRLSTIDARRFWRKAGWLAGRYGYQQKATR